MKNTATQPHTVSTTTSWHHKHSKLIDFLWGAGGGGGGGGEAQMPINPCGLRVLEALVLAPHETTGELPLT